MLVIGAGPAGCAAGITLARAGIDVCVVDRAEFPRAKTCGDAVSNHAVTLARELGAGGWLDAGPHALVRHAAAVFPGDLRVARDLAEPGWIVPRFSFDDTLRRSLETSGARLIQSVQVRRIDAGAKGVEAIFGEGFRWRSRILVAADGPSSVAWPTLGRAKPRGRALAMASTAYYGGVAFPAGPDVADHYFEVDIPYGYGWIFPAVEGVSNVGVYQRDDAQQRSSRRLPALLDEFVARHPDRFSAARRIGAIRTWPLPIGGPGPAAGRGILLAGDAGGFIDPLSGEGIWQALYTGQQAGSIAAQAVAAGELTRQLADRYERLCINAIRRPSQAKARIQAGMTVFVERGLYRSRVLRGILQWGYAHST